MHGDVGDVVQFAEDAELGKLGDACEEDETEIWLTVFQGTVEVAHDVSQHFQFLIFVDDIQ